ncbi:MAG TPA: phytanoyl-CoA dioxygenase family protein [Planctomycetota bacterium]|nr:phytanoyl-CoA dioxygenase family protein [Planctomycetota bacterium]
MQTQPHRDLRFFPVPEDRARRRLSAQQVRDFNARGYLAGLPVFAPDEVVRNRAAFDDLLAQAARLGMHNYQLTNYERMCACIHDLVTAPALLDHVADILGDAFVCWGTHCFCKMPGDPKAVTWHQDATYWNLSPSKTVTAWLAIDDADVGNSAVRVIPGSHLLGPLPMRQSRDDENNALWLTTDGAEGHGAAESMCLRAGEISLHTDLLLHDSLPNTSTRRRCGLAIRYCTTDVRIAGGGGRSAVICRGVDPEGYWQPMPRPDGDTITATTVPVETSVSRAVDAYARP